MLRYRGWAPFGLAYGTFVLVGISSGAGGVLLLTQMTGYHVDRASIGITFFTVSAGYVLSSLATGALIQRFGFRIALTAGACTFVIGGLYLATRPPFTLFVLAQLIPGFGVGVLETVLNAYLAALPGATTRLNRLHAFWAVGALIGPVFAARIVAVAPWTVVWLVLALACVPLAVGFAVVYPAQLGEGPGSPPEAASLAADPAVSDAAVPDTAVSDSAVSGSAVSGSAAHAMLRAALREPGILFGAAMLSVYVGVEMSVGSWGFSYLVQDRSLSGSLAGWAMSGYWLGLTLGRFLISPIATKRGVTTASMIYGCLAGVTAATMLAWLSPAASLTSGALLLTGFFLGPIFPTTMSIVPMVAPARLAPTAIGFMNAASLVGGSALPWVAGAIAQSTGIWALMPYTLVLAVFQFVVWRPLAGRIGGSASLSPAGT